MSFREKDLARRFIVFIDAVYESKVGVLYPWISWVVHSGFWIPTGLQLEFCGSQCPFIPRIMLFFAFCVSDWTDG